MVAPTYDEGAAKLLDEIVALSRESPAASSLHATALAERLRLTQPIRVAVIGLIKAGKSTLMNALLGAPVLPTGLLETTFNINWLRYAEEPKIVLHWGDDRPSESFPIERLAEHTARQGLPEAARDIRLIEVHYPAEILKHLNLIDTPGLASAHGVDSQKTADLLRLGEIAGEASRQQTSEADAILCLFERSVHEASHDVLRHFQGATVGVASPLNAVGALTQFDRLEPPEQALAAARSIAQRLMGLPEMRQTLFRIEPIASLPVIALRRRDPQLISDLAAITALPDPVFAELAKTEQRFARAERDDVPVPPARRLALRDSFGTWTVRRVRNLVISGASPDIDAALDLVLTETGVPEIERILRDHFGRRARLIRANAATSRLSIAASRLAAHGDPDARNVGAAAQRAIETFQLASPAIAAYDILQEVYAGRLPLSASETNEVRAITGEYGDAAAERLCLPLDASAELLLRTVRLRAVHWRARANDSQLIGGADANALRKVSRLFEHLCSEL